MFADGRFLCPYFSGIVFSVFFMCAFLVSGTAVAAVFSAQAADLSAEIRAARAEGRRLLVLFELSDCPECRTMQRQVFSDARVEAEFDRLYRTVRIVVDTEDAIVDFDGEAQKPLEIARKLTVSATPSFVFFMPDGTLEYRYSGALSADEFLRLGRFVFDAIYEEQSFSDYLLASHSTLK